MVPGLIRPTSRAVLRNAKPTARLWKPTGTRFVSTQPPHLRSRTWKSSALRWGIAVAGIYYYNTSPVFAEQPHHNLLNPNVDPIDESNETSALDELLSRRSKEAQQNHEALAADPSTSPSQDAQNVGGQGVAELEAEAQGEGAFNPETGEINWDCPCLGGMAHGPCGPEFREAFSCFIYSEEEPKGMECIDKFQGMRDCFQRHPEVYKDELMEDEELDAELEAEKQELVNQIAERRRSDEAAATSGHRLLEEPAPASKSSKTLSKDDSTSSAKASVTQAVADVSATSQNQPQPEARATTDTDVRSEPVRENTIEGQNSDAAKSFMSDSVSHDTPPDEGDELVPKAAHDARETGRTGSHPPKGE